MVTKLWENPDIFSIQVELPENPLRALNSYVITSPQGNLVIDTGFNRPECREDLWRGLEELGLDLTKTSLFLTHLHADHSGLVWDFVDRGCPVYMGRIDLDYLENRRNMTFMEELFRQEGFPQAVLDRQARENQARRYSAAPGFPAQPVEDGQVLQLAGLELRCIHTPGHTPGHMVLYLPRQRLLFSGDHILFDITPNIAVWSTVPHSLADYLASLDKLRGLDVQRTFPAHRGGGEDIYRRIGQLEAHHAQRLEEIFQAVAACPGSTAYELAGRITWSARGLGWEQFPPHQKWFAMGETLSHLRWLAHHGRVVRTEEEGLFRYYPA